MENSHVRTDKDLRSLYRQRIENSNQVFYEFDYAGSFVSSSDYAGLTILDSTEQFSIDKIYDFPTGLFKSKPIGKTFALIKINNNYNRTTERDTLLTPSKEYTTGINGVKFSVTEYNSTYGSATMNTGLMHYEFDSYKETKDSLTFFNISKKFGGKEFNENQSFEKGNIKVIEDDSKNLLFIQIKQLVIERGNIYKPTSPFELVSDQPIVGYVTYEFYPRNRLTTEELSDFGLWRRVK